MPVSASHIWGRGAEPGGPSAAEGAKMPEGRSPPPHTLTFTPRATKCVPSFKGHAG